MITSFMYYFMKHVRNVNIRLGHSEKQRLLIFRLSPIVERNLSLKQFFILDEFNI